MTSVNISNTQTDLYSDECNQIKENIQNFLLLQTYRSVPLK